jgi:hypothetical protein
MDNLENKPSGQSDIADLQEQCASLRHLLVSVLVLLLVVSGTLTIFLLRQWRFTQSDLNTARPQIAQMTTNYVSANASMSDFLKKLTDYGKTHPDFAPILAKYGVKPNAPTSSVPAGAPKKK